MRVQGFEGFPEFVTTHNGSLSRVAYLLTGDHQAAQDLVQNALIKVAYRWARLAKPEAYARRVLYHEAVNIWRRRRVAEYSSARMPDRASGVDEADRAERRVVLARVLAHLTPRQRAVLVLRFFDDRSEAEAAELLGCGVGTVKSQTHRAPARLRALAPELADVVESPH